MLAPILHITPQITISRKRSLPVPGKLLVRQGQTVRADDIVAEGVCTPEHVLLDITRGLDVRSKEAEKYIVCREGAQVEAGDLIAGPVGFTKRVVRAPSDGKVMLIRDHLVILEKRSAPDKLNAHYPGEVVGLIEDKGVIIQTAGALIQGVWGNEQISHGRLRSLSSNASPLIDNGNAGDYQGEILYLQTCETSTAFEALTALHLRGLIVGNLAPCLASKAQVIDFPILVLVGFGKVQVNETIQGILSDHEGCEVTLSAENWDRYASTQPEVFIPSPTIEDTVPASEEFGIAPGQTVRVINSSYYGKVGTIEELRSEGVLSNGIRTETAIVRFRDNKRAQIPLANLVVIV